MEKEKISHVDNPLTSIRLNARDKLRTYLNNSQESHLRNYQLSTLDSLLKFFEAGESEGYISVPTSFGKTIVATELAHVLGLNTLILSPTLLILEQTQKTAHRFNKTINMTKYYSEQKDLSGTVINTTYQSVFNLLAKKELDGEKIELVICDEVHTALGEKRHTLFKHFPHALMIGLTATPYFTPLEGYKIRGLLKEDDRVVGLCENLIHEMSLEEGMEQAILEKCEVYLIQSHQHVEHITMQGDDYNKALLEQQLNKEARNYYVIGLLAGLDQIPKHVTFKPEQIEIFIRLQKKIKGKRTAIFGLSIKHIEDLAKQLRERNISAETIHGNKKNRERNDILERHASGMTQVLLGVDILRLGWDSPATEVGIYMAPTLSGIVAMQEFGRILRKSEATGKNKAIAIQIVDEFTDQKQSPILIPNLFDPNYVLRGTQEGKQYDTTKTSKNIQESAITFTGMSLEPIIERFATQALLQQRFSTASVEETYQILENLIRDIRIKNPSLSAYELYKELAEKLPGRMSYEFQIRARQAVASIDTNTVLLGKQTIVLTHIKSILSAISPYIFEEREENDDLIQEVILGIYERLDSDLKNHQNPQMSSLIYKKARLIADRFVELKSIPVDNFDDLTLTIADQTNRITTYIDIQKSLKKLTPQEQKAVKIGHDFHTAPYTELSDVANELGISRQRVQQIRDVGLSKIRRILNKEYEPQ